MMYALRSVRLLPSTNVSILPPPSRFSRKVTAISFATASEQPVNQPNMDQKQMDKKKTDDPPPNDKTGDVMSHSYGEGYATRADEEGFGGIYGSNQTLQKDKDHIHENHPDYDKKQGNESKEEEKARNQTQSNC